MSISRLRKEMTTLRKMKTLLLILLAAALLAACAALPAVAAALQDRSAVNHSGFSGLKSVKLELHEEKGTLPMMGKLACLRNMACQYCADTGFHDRGGSHCCGRSGDGAL